jgi:hypothetical protein
MNEFGDLPESLPLACNGLNCPTKHRPSAFCCLSAADHASRNAFNSGEFNACPNPFSLFDAESPIAKLPFDDNHTIVLWLQGCLHGLLRALRA